MLKRVICNKCKSILEYDDKSVWEGNRDFEDFICPVCKNVVATVLTDSPFFIQKFDKKRTFL